MSTGVRGVHIDLPSKPLLQSPPMLDAKVWWPLFPLLLLIVIVCLTWALVLAVRGGHDLRARWLQVGALTCYLLAAVSAVGSERGAVSANLHRPFSLATQLCLLLALVHRIFRMDLYSRSDAYIITGLIVSGFLQAGWSAFAVLVVQNLVAGAPVWVMIILYATGALST